MLIRTKIPNSDQASKRRLILKGTCPISPQMPPFEFHLPNFMSLFFSFLPISLKKTIISLRLALAFVPSCCEHIPRWYNRDASIQVADNFAVQHAMRTSVLSAEAI